MVDHSARRGVRTDCLVHHLVLPRARSRRGRSTRQLSRCRGQWTCCIRLEHPIQLFTNRVCGTSGSQTGQEHFVIQRVLSIVAALILAPALSSCTPPSQYSEPVVTQKAQLPSAAPTAVECKNELAGEESNELTLQGPEHEAWGLVLFSGRQPFTTAESTRIVWRVTGSGAFDTWALDPSGHRAGPTSRPDKRVSSNYDRPGEEWGAEYEFTEPGCWTLAVQRSEGVLKTTILVIS